MSRQEAFVLQEDDILPEIRTRSSVVAFSSCPVEAAVRNRLFEAARWAPSSSNEQPWRFLVATRDSSGEHARFLSLLAEANRTWAIHAPLLVLVVAKTISARTGGANLHAWYDVGQGVAHLSIQAVREGLAVHQMGGFDRDRAAAELALPPDYQPVVMLAIGYHDPAARIPDAVRARETAVRKRRPMDAIVGPGTWTGKFEEANS